MSDEEIESMSSSITIAQIITAPPGDWLVTAETVRGDSGTVTHSSAEAAPVLVYALARVTDEDGTWDWLVPVTWFSVDEESLTSFAGQWLNQTRHAAGSGGYRTESVLRMQPGELPDLRGQAPHVMGCQRRCLPDEIDNTDAYYGVMHSAECREAQREEHAKFAASVKQ